MFVGAGFSKAVLNGGEEDIALSWGELLEAAAKKMKVDGLWKDADPDIPVLKEAKAEYAKLQ